MSTKENFRNLRIRKCPWYVWILRLVWVVWLIFWAEVAVGSWKEFEQRALIISSIVFILSFLAGFILWFIGNKRRIKIK
ncbi:hypothetical protein ACFLT2_04040 [Acidobacteriota bacterium]